MRLISYCILLLLSSVFSAGRAVALPPAQEIIFAINSPGSPPYLYFDTQSQSYQGVVVDFFASFAEEANLNVTYLDSSRARNELLLRQGKADMFLSGEEWLDDPSGFIFSKPLIQHDSYLYATTEFDGPFVPAESNGEAVCTRFGFKYPVLQGAFEDQEHPLLRVDSASQTLMALMLTKGRCDFAIMSEQNALSVLNKRQFCYSEFYQSPNVISSVDLVLVSRPAKQTLLPLINRYMDRFINSGQLSRSIKRHSGDHKFPKLTCD